MLFITLLFLSLLLDAYDQVKICLWNKIVVSSLLLLCSAHFYHYKQLMFGMCHILHARNISAANPLDHNITNAY